MGTRRDGTPFEWMGEPIEECVDEVLEWCGAPQAVSSEAKRILAGAQRGDYALLHEVIGVWLEDVDLTLNRAGEITPMFMLRGSVVPGPHETSFRYVVNDHGNVTVYDGNNILWDCV